MLHVSLVTACIILDSVSHLGIPKIREVDATWTLQPTFPKALAIISPLTKHSLQHTKWCPFFGGRRLDENELRHFESLPLSQPKKHIGGP